ncbi:MAG: bifunctional 23S rRNA (guanine(2069)-N(7))-methyltransferase RlmK/23S rRNA (guanine(2445)-N(2))-methyltransferase RlmL [Deltaproteobacteria bacterium]|nr:bifunctional 23S rRNA (guanine(2069)-N(7))-methyltransferase RlmK/23S rRNA (guanine(2445)-N(2))-methyltransferase RlmL [Deltaproteobacteria bacterium]
MRPEDTEVRRFFATAALGLEPLLEAEVKTLGAEKVRAQKGGVFFSATLETAYRACLWSRLASRVLLPLCTFPAGNPEELYAGIREIDWNDHLEKDGTLAVDCNISRSRIKHSHFAALKAKDAVVDQFRDNFGMRPSVNVEKPDVRINLHLESNRLTVSLDLSGASLHRRSYREEGGPAPLKENLAAAILIFSDWPAIAARGGTLLDPMCGSGTLLVEGALLAADIAPGLRRDYFGFLGWKGHQPSVWKKLLREAEARRDTGIRQRPLIFGYDHSMEAINGARINARQAGVEDLIRLEQTDLRNLTTLPSLAQGNGLLITNPPYGQRLGREENLQGLYQLLGNRIRHEFSGWKAAVLTAAPELEKMLGLHAEKERRLFNGPIECRLYHYRTGSQAVKKGEHSTTPWPSEIPARQVEISEMLANRLRKNLRNLRRWREKEDVTCFRLYDADIPEYAAAIDIYEEWAHIQEYAPPFTINPDLAQLRLQEIVATLAAVLETDPAKIFLKIRKKQKGRDQYAKLDHQDNFHKVREGGLRFLVNFSDYLDTGLFLDHRPTRHLIRDMAAGKSFLNLFAYTGTASVCAAAGGAKETLSVDSSRTYLEWAENNFHLNRLNSEKHSFIQADCLEWLKNENRRFDFIFLDPPTFSNSKSRKGSFDIQRDYPDLLRQTARLMAPDGTLIFSNNFKKFKMETELFPELHIIDVSKQTIPLDFQRTPRIHQCWMITHRKK